MAIFAVLANSNSFGQPCSPTFVITKASNGQVIPITPGSGGALQFACLDVSASNSTEYIATVIHSSCPPGPGIPQYFLETAGGIEPIGAAPNPNLNIVNGTVFTSTIRFRSKNDILCKGRITFRVVYPPTTITTPACTTNCGPPPTGINPAQNIAIPGGTFTTSIDIYKNITAYDAIIGPQCVVGGDLVTYSINPRLQCAADGLGLDNITWNVASFAGTVNIGPGTVISSCPPPYTCNPANTNTNIRVAYASSDRTSITLYIPTNVVLNGTQNFNATIGNCPSGGLNLPGRTIYRAPAEMWVTYSNVSNNNAVAANQALPASCFAPAPSTACITTLNGSPIISGFNVSGALENGIVLPVTLNGSQTISVSANGNGANSGFSYTWTGGNGMTLNQQNGINDPAAQIITPSNETGTFTVNLQNVGNQGNCGTNSSRYSIYRILSPPNINSTPLPVPILPTSEIVAPAVVPKYNYITNSNAIINLNPTGNIPKNTPKSCFAVGEFEDLTLENAPTGPLADFRWTVPNGWTIISLNGTVSSNSNGVLIGKNVTRVRVTATANSVSGFKVKVRMVLPTFANASTLTWQGITEANNTEVLYPYPFDANSNLTLQGASGYTLNPVGIQGTSPKRTNVTLNFPTTGQSPSCGADQLEFQYGFNGRVTETATGISIDYFSNGSGTTPDPSNDASWACNSGIFGQTDGCGTNWRSGAAAGDLNVAFRTGFTYKGWYRVRVRTRLITANPTPPTPCPALACYSSIWSMYPSSGAGQNWRMAVASGEWDGGDVVVPINTEKAVEVFPNPTSKDFTLRVAEEEVGNNYEIANMEGKTLKSGKLEARETKVSTKGLSPGFYFIKIMGAKILQEKLLIE